MASRSKSQVFSSIIFAVRSRFPIEIKTISDEKPFPTHSQQQQFQRQELQSEII
jgi:hypothetical protein